MLRARHRMDPIESKVARCHYRGHHIVSFAYAESSYPGNPEDLQVLGGLQFLSGKHSGSVECLPNPAGASRAQLRVRGSDWGRGMRYFIPCYEVGFVIFASKNSKSRQVCAAFSYIWGYDVSVTRPAFRGRSNPYRWELRLWSSFCLFFPLNFFQV